MRGMLSIHVVLGLILIPNVSPCFSAEPYESPNPARQPDITEQVKKHIYKHTPQGELEIFIHLPNEWKSTDKRLAIVFFFGGGFNTGRIDEFMRHANYFASRGMVTARADYRVKDRHGTMPDKCIEDAKSAIRWLRANADQYGIDPNRIVAAGHSAGATMSACAATTRGLEADGEDLSISSKPNFLVLFSAPLDVYWSYAKRLGSREIEASLSAYDNLTPDLPPTILLYGMEDPRHLMDGLGFAYKSGKLGNIVELYAAEDQSHNFHKTSPWFERTLYLTDQFLTKHGYLVGEPTINLPEGKVGMSQMTSNDLSLMESLNHTPLHIAAQSGNNELVQALIAAGIDVNLKNRWGYTALYIAASIPGDMEVVQTLIDAGATDPLWGYVIAYDGYKELATGLISKGADVNIQDQFGWTPLHYAVDLGRKEMIELFIVNGADVNIATNSGQPPIILAMNETQNEMVELLLSKGASIPPLHLALFYKDEAKARELIESGANVNEKTSYGSTPLHWACNAGLAEIAELLIEKGANVNAKENWNWTPLHSAVYQGEQMVNRLVFHGADVNAKDGSFRTPLSYAKEEGHSEIVEILTRAAKNEKKAFK